VKPVNLQALRQPVQVAQISSAGEQRAPDAVVPAAAPPPR